ncbi:MAG: ABC transporter permease [Thermofilum sp.]|jgi:ABC-2 type transport system permease protein|uniref:ABC transporter permease n=1 Tax=Thermofilum sp. TaxID=1961369 RepID=UPI002585F485|nr:ABC transporter permease [Thermofilum sp.]MCI4409270.1 ABC transporter permease [Thermofilum sp.]
MIRALVLKEVKDLLRDPRILIPFILSAVAMPVIALVILLPMQSAVQQAISGAKTVAVLDLDKTTYSQGLIRYLESNGVQVIEVTGDPQQKLQEIANSLAKQKISVLLVINRGFGAQIAEKKPAKIQLVSIIEELSMFSGIEVTPIQQLVNDYVLGLLINGTNLTLELVKNPVNVTSVTYLSSKNLLFPYGPAFMASFSLSALFVPLIVMGIAMTVMQMSATSMAVENEERTLETLLTLPVSSTQILVSKLLGMFIVSLVGTVFEVIGLVLYFGILSYAFSLPTPNAQALIGMPTSLSEVVPASGIPLLALSLILSLFFYASIGVIVGALSRDVRIANTLMSPIGIIFIVPAYLIIFAPSSFYGPAVRALLYILPITQPTIMARDMIASQLPPETPVYLLASLLFSLILIYVAGKFFSLETLSTLQYRVEELASRIKRKKERHSIDTD